MKVVFSLALKANVYLNLILKLLIQAPWMWETKENEKYLLDREDIALGLSDLYFWVTFPIAVQPCLRKCWMNWPVLFRERRALESSAWRKCTSGLCPWALVLSGDSVVQTHTFFTECPSVSAGAQWLNSWLYWTLENRACLEDCI